MDTNPSPLNKTEASRTHDSAPCFIHHPQGAQSSPPCPPDTCSFRIPGPRLPVCPSSLTALWSADSGELQGSVLRNMLFSTYIQSVKSSTVLGCYATLGCFSLHTHGPPCVPFRLCSNATSFPEAFPEHCTLSRMPTRPSCLLSPAVFCP